MSLTVIKTGHEISTENLYVKCTTNNPVNVDSVIMEVYVEGFGTSPVHTVEHVPDAGTTAVYTFEVNSILRNFFEFEFSTGGSYTKKNVLATLIFREVIGLVPQAPDANKQIINLKEMSFDTIEIKEFDLGIDGLFNYYVGDGGNTSSRFLTSAPLTVPIAVQDLRRFFLSIYAIDYTAGVNNQVLRIETYNEAGGLIDTSDVNINPTSRTPVTYVTADKYDIYTVAKALLITPNYYKLVCYVKDAAGPSVRSETRTFININNNKSRIRGVTVHWKNEFGVQECYPFIGEFNRLVRTKSREFRKVNVGDEVIGNEFNYVYELSTGRLPQEMIVWLTKMLRSKKLAIERFDPYMGAGGQLSSTFIYYPIVLETDDFQDESEYDPKTIFKIKFRFAKPRKGI